MQGSAARFLHAPDHPVATQGDGMTIELLLVILFILFIMAVIVGYSYRR